MHTKYLIRTKSLLTAGYFVFPMFCLYIIAVSSAKQKNEMYVSLDGFGKNIETFSIFFKYLVSAKNDKKSCFNQIPGIMKTMKCLIFNSCIWKTTEK